MYSVGVDAVFHQRVEWFLLLFLSLADSDDQK